MKITNKKEVKQMDSEWRKIENLHKVMSKIHEILAQRLTPPEPEETEEEEDEKKSN